MKSRRSLWALLSALFSVAGTSVVLIATYSTSDLADAAVLLGATLLGLAVFALFMALAEHRRLKALTRHMSRNTTASHPANRKPLANSKPLVKVQNNEDVPVQVVLHKSHR